MFPRGNTFIIYPMGPYEGMMVRRKDPKVIETNNNGKIENM